MTYACPCCGRTTWWRVCEREGVACRRCPECPKDTACRTTGPQVVVPPPAAQREMFE